MYDLGSVEKYSTVYNVLDERKTIPLAKEGSGLLLWTSFVVPSESNALKLLELY